MKEATHDHFFDFCFWNKHKSQYDFKLFIPEEKIPLLNHAEYLCINYEMIVPLLDDFFQKDAFKNLELEFQKYFVEVSE